MDWRHWRQSWSTPANWSPFSLTGGPNGPPGSGDAAFLGSLGESVVVGSGVNAAVDALFMGDIFDPAAGVTNAPILTVDNGRKFTIDGAGSILADGAIDVQTGATMVWDFSGTFINGATIIIGKFSAATAARQNPAATSKSTAQSRLMTAASRRLLYIWVTRSSRTRVPGRLQIAA